MNPIRFQIKRTVLINLACFSSRLTISHPQFYFNDTSGSISSLNYSPKYYTQNQLEFVITTLPEKHLKLHFSNIEINCPSFLKITWQPTDSKFCDYEESETCVHSTKSICDTPENYTVDGFDVYEANKITILFYYFDENTNFKSLIESKNHINFDLRWETVSKTFGPTNNDLEHIPTNEEICENNKTKLVSKKPKTPPFEANWIVHISYYHRDGVCCGKCSGSWVSKNHIITAAHCMDSLPSIFTSEIAGFISKKLPNGKKEFLLNFTRSDVVLHPKYSGLPWSNNENDIAVIKFCDFEIDHEIIKLPEFKEEIADFEHLWVYGWGMAKYRYKFSPNTVRNIKVPFVEPETCEAIYGSLRNYRGFKNVGPAPKFGHFWRF